MPLLQSLRQQHFLEKSAAPSTSRQVLGMSGTSEGVPKMHPLKSSLPTIKAASMLHSLKIKKFKLKGLKT